MIAKRLLGIALAALAMFIWGFVYWAGIGSKLRPYKTLPTETESAVVAELKTGAIETNVYAIPGMPESGATKEANDAWTERSKEGPLVNITYVKEGKDPMAPSMMIKGFLHMLVTASALTVLLIVASDRLPSYGKRVLYVGFIGLIAGFWVDVGQIVWMYNPLNNALFHFGYSFSGILIGGLVLAAFVKKPTSGP